MATIANTSYPLLKVIYRFTCTSATVINHKNYNFHNCDWFKKLLFPTNSLAKLLSDSLLSDSSTNQSHSKL